MEQYISKSALVAELEKLKSNLIYGACASQIAMETRCKEEAYNEILSYLNSLEVKEVDLEEEMNKWRQKHFKGIGYILDGSGEWLERTSQLDIAKHFYELGLKAKGE